jgi:hypothetical protein
VLAGTVLAGTASARVVALAGVTVASPASKTMVSMAAEAAATRATIRRPRCLMGRS